MRTAAAVILSLIASPALALQHPVGAKGGDPRACEVIYDPNDIVDITVEVGHSVSVKFSPTDHKQLVAVSDSEHLKETGIEGANILFFKARTAMPPQPVQVRTTRDDGSTRDYMMQFSAIAPEDSDRPAQVAATGPVAITQTTPVTCYSIRYLYPGDDKAAQAAAWRTSADRAKREAAEIALHKAQSDASRNKRYIGVGDASLAPLEISDDGNTTELRFPGNVRIPALFTTTPDGGWSQISGITTEDNGVVKIHGTLPIIRLVDGELVLCITNRGYSAVGNNPGTGTTSPNISREVHSR